MTSPFPGMDPYLERSALWPDVHPRLIRAISARWGGRVGDRYWVGLERRDYVECEDPVVREIPSMNVVTIVGVLSRSNRLEGPGRQEYLIERQEVLRTRTHLVELDLLLAGERLPVRGRLPACDYVSFVHRAEARPRAEARLTADAAGEPPDEHDDEEGAPRDKARASRWSSTSCGGSRSPWGSTCPRGKGA